MLQRKPVMTSHRSREDALARAGRILNTVETEGRGPTDEEKAEFDTAVKQVDSIDRLHMRDQLHGDSGDGSHTPFPGEHSGRITALSGGTVKAFSNDRTGKEAAYKSGRFLMATLLGDEGSRVWCRDAGMDIDTSIRMAHSAGVNTAGGVLVPEEFSSTIIRLVEEYGVFRQLARVMPMSSDTQHIPRRVGGLEAHYVGEGVAGTESDSTWDDVQLVAKKLMVLTRMSSEIAEDSIISMADMLALEAAQAIALKEDTVGFTGTGISTDGGITGVNVKIIDGNHGLAVVDATSGTDLLTEIDADDLTNLMSVIPMYARRGSSWICSPTALDVVFNAIKTAAGGNTGDVLSDLNTPRFLGYPIAVSDVYPDNASTDLNNAVMIGFGNLSQACTLGSRREVRVAVSSDAYFAEDQIGVKVTMRHDINVHDLGSDSVKSPFAVLIGNT